MAKQNIYDNETFFDGYKKLRENEENANILFEMPALFSLLPDLKDKRVLDLGCGFGEHCMEYVRRGAKEVVGIDISDKMLEVAKKENSDEKITYLLMPMEDIGNLEGKFDVVISSLAFHYVEEFKGLIENIYKLLNDGGVLVFSQEHPFNTCFSGGMRWTRNEEGEKIYANISNYGVEKEFESNWFVDGVKKYHRKFSTIVNTLADAGFMIVKAIEPVPDEDFIKEHPSHKDLYHKPDFLLIKAKRV